MEITSSFVFKVFILTGLHRLGYTHEKHDKKYRILLSNIHDLRNEMYDEMDALRNDVTEAALASVRREIQELVSKGRSGLFNSVGRSFEIEKVKLRRANERIQFLEKRVSELEKLRKLDVGGSASACLCKKFTDKILTQSTATAKHVVLASDLNSTDTSTIGIKNEADESGDRVLHIPIAKDRTTWEYKTVLCPSFNFDNDTLNRQYCSIPRQNVLINQPSESPWYESATRLTKYRGVIGGRSFFGSGCWYWQVKAKTKVLQFRGDRDVLNVGLGHKDVIDSVRWLGHSRRSWSLRLCSWCHGPSSNRFCAGVWWNGLIQSQYTVQQLHAAGSSVELVYGLLLDLDRRRLHFIDVNRNINIFTLSDIDVAMPLWPVFGVFQKSVYETELTLVTGSDISFHHKLTELIGRILM